MIPGMIHGRRWTGLRDWWKTRRLPPATPGNLWLAYACGGISYSPRKSGPHAVEERAGAVVLGQQAVCPAAVPAVWGRAAFQYLQCSGLYGKRPGAGRHLVRPGVQQRHQLLALYERVRLCPEKHRHLLAPQDGRRPFRVKCQNAVGRLRVFHPPAQGKDIFIGYRTQGVDVLDAKG